jgi:hypothetical protein
VSYLENSKNVDLVSPGEQWFFYWKTSAVLWESRILQIPQQQVIFIPLNWGLHAGPAQEWDFGSLQAEKDLYRLVKLLTQHGRKFCWLLPLTPAPFLPNGGIPVTSARTLSLGKTGVHLAALDHEGQLHKMFSFFEPKVFTSFTSFLKAFGTFLGSHNIKAPVWGSSFYFYEDGHKHSFLEDSSVAFEQGFSRFLKNYLSEDQLMDPRAERDLKRKFTEDVQGLFENTAEAVLTPFWMGTQRIVSLGASPKETILRSLPAGKSQLEFTKDLFQYFLNSDWISSALLNSGEKKELLEWILAEHFGPNEVEERYHYNVPHREMTDEFRPFGIVDIFGGKTLNEKIGLTPYLYKNFRWLYQRHDHFLFSPEWINLNQSKVKFFHGSELDRVSFSQILKLFMMGQRVILNRTGLGEGLEKKLQIFLIENSIRVQDVNFMTPTQICELGEGRLIIFEGERLIDNSNRETFWAHIFRFLNLVQPEMVMDEDVFSLWRVRSTSQHELSYLDVRRVNIYNPTSYKKIVFIKTHKHFAFMKVIDPMRASVKSTTEGVDVELLPNGKIALDFGHYEEI